jgi:hypothetical protein
LITIWHTHIIKFVFVALSLEEFTEDRSYVGW